MSTQPRSATPLISTRIDSPHSVREVPVGSRDAARLLRMHPKTVLRKAREGTLPAHPVGRDRKRWHFYLSELDDWLRSQVIGASLARQ
jgi:excisionase family DNA binding protein